MTRHRAHPLVQLRHVSKTFGGSKALDDVSLDIAEGEIHALAGQNGSGKSTLIKILTGYHAPDDGAEVEVLGTSATLGHSRISSPGRDVPIRVVHQDAGLVNGLDAVDNIALGVGFTRTRTQSIAWRRQRDLTQRALDLVGARGVPLDRPVGELPVIQRAQIAIARALTGWEHEGGLLLLDEPTSALSETEADELLSMLRDLRSAGVSILYISHRLDEILRLADRVTVIRDGLNIDTVPTTSLDYDGLVSLMIGDARDLADGARRPPPASNEGAPDATLAVEDLGSATLDGLSFSARLGEVLGITGLAGSGHEDVPLLLVGARRASSGTLRVGGVAHDLRTMTPRRAQAAGVALVPADRKVSGLVMGMPIAHNISLPRVGSFMQWGRINRRHERTDVGRWIDSLTISPAVAEAPVHTLSGGNQQKVVIAKCLGVSTGALVLADPTAGVDVGARAAIYRRFREEADKGLSIVVCSSDPEDLVHACDRVIVLSKGRPSAELTGDRITKEEILHACGQGASTDLPVHALP